MKYCPLMSASDRYSGPKQCFDKHCALAGDETGECLIKQALALYLGSARTHQAKEEEKSKFLKTALKDINPKDMEYLYPLALRSTE